MKIASHKEEYAGKRHHGAPVALKQSITEDASGRHFHLIACLAPPIHKETIR